MTAIKDTTNRNNTSLSEQPILFIPVGIVGCGKSSLSRLMKELIPELVVVSSDSFSTSSLHPLLLLVGKLTNYLIPLSPIPLGTKQTPTESLNLVDAFKMQY